MNRPHLHCVTLALFVTILLTARTDAAGHPDVTVLRMGPGQITKDHPEDSWRLPMGATGPLPQALVLMGSQPKAAKEFKFPMSQPADPNAPPEMEQVPATIKFTIAGQELPPWELHPFVTAYVINVDVIRRNPEFANGRMAIKAELVSRADHFDFVVFAMPDPLLLNETLNGPLAAFFDAATDSEIKAYFKALAFEIGGENVNALLEYRKLAQSQNERLARIARRGVRLFGFETRPRKLTGNFMEHWRWALYLQQCSLFGPAFGEFNECRVIYPLHAESQFRAGEMLDRLDADQFKQLRYMERCYEASFPKKVSPWYTLFVILMSRQDKTIANDRLFDLKGDWVVVQRMVEAATGGAVRIVTTTHEFKDEAEHTFRTYQGGAGILPENSSTGGTPVPPAVPGPSEDLIGARGWFDSVIFIRPRVAGDKEPDVLTAGGDSGPKGAAISCLYDDATWKEMFQAWYQHYTWAAQVGEIGEGYPSGHDLWDCGHQPVPHEAYSLRAALRYNFTPAMALRPKMTDLCAPGNHVRLWQIKGPFAISNSATDHRPLNTGHSLHHVLDPLNSGPSAKSLSIVSNTDFIDFAKLLGKTGAALAQATTWVYSPVDQDVRMWLGQNDGAAVWLNGRLIHEGRYYSGGNYEDQNLVDTVAAHAPLKAGWNELRLVVEAWPAPRDRGWGFSVRFCDFNGKPLPGLAYLNEPPAEGLVPPYTPPKAGEHYAWRDVKKDYQEFLPRLTVADLQHITSIPNLALDGGIEKAGGFFSLAAPDRKASATYRAVSTTWQPGKDSDVALNNAIDWDREACAAFAYQKDGKPRDLFLVKPEALTAYLTLLNEPAEAKSTFAGRPREERFLGYVVIPVVAGEHRRPAGSDPHTSSTSRTLLVLDTYLGEEAKWPRDEEDLMNPIAPYVPNPPDPRPRP